VWCTVFGDKGDTGSVKLSNSKNNFERNAADVFTLRNLRNVGAISHLTIGHDNSLMGAAWHLREVRVGFGGLCGYTAPGCALKVAPGCALCSRVAPGCGVGWLPGVVSGGYRVWSQVGPGCVVSGGSPVW
jgi:hypothetical protein